MAQWAFALAEARLADELPRRWRHVQGVARQAHALRPLVGDDAALLRAAAVLHDIGYAPDLVVTGFHPVDGALYLQRIGAPKRLTDLVAHHSCARVEAHLRNLDREISAFTDEGGTVRDALWFCDMTAGPDGAEVAASERLREIRTRYGPGHVVTRFVEDATEELLAAVQRTEDRLNAVVAST